MNSDLGPIQRALRALHYTTPLDYQDARYVERTDGLRQKLLNRLLAPASARLLLSGPAGCGKSTELLQIAAQVKDHYLVVHCPCDRQLNLFNFELNDLFRYVMWRVLMTANEAGLVLTPEIVKQAQDCIGYDGPIGNPKGIFSSDFRPTRQLAAAPTDKLLLKLAAPPPSVSVPITESEVFHTFRRLLQEAGNLKTVLLLIDGLEKLPGEVFSSLVPVILRSYVFDACQSIVVVPNWALHGWGSLAQIENIEVLEIPAIEERAFIRAVLMRRAAGVFTEAAIDEIARLSAGVVRDALQLATGACRAAADAGDAQVSPQHVAAAQAEMARAYHAIFSDDPPRVQRFLQEVQRTGHLAGDPEMRDRLLSSGAVLRRLDGSFLVHPVLTDQPLAQAA